MAAMRIDCFLQTIRRKQYMRIFAILGLLMALSPGPATPALAQIKVLTSFTVFADMARNVAGEHAEVVSITREGAEIHMFRPTPGDIKRGLGADVVLWNGLGLETWFERYLENLGDVKAYVLSDGVEPISIGDGPYEGRANPHAWMSPGNANIYIDNIVRALSETDPDNAAAYAANGEAYKTQIAPLSHRSGRHRGAAGRTALAGDKRGRVLLPGPRFRPEGSLDLGDQRRQPGLAAAGAPHHRPDARQRNPGDLFGKHGFAEAGRAGGTGNRSGLWRRALRGFAFDAGRAGSNLSRPAQGDIGNDRRRTDGKAMNAPATAGSQTVAKHRPRRA
jgi:hypothetical protein